MNRQNWFSDLYGLVARLLGMGMASGIGVMGLHEPWGGYCDLK